MYYINEVFMRNIHRLFDKTQKQFSVFALNSQQLWPQRLTYFNRMLVEDIIKISNATQIPVKYFFSQKENGEKFFTLDGIRVLGEWKPVVVNKEGLERIYKGSNGRHTREELMAFLKIDSSCFWRWVNTDSCKMRLQQACDICNRFGIEMSEIILDENADMPPAPDPNVTRSMLEENAAMKEHINTQSEQIDKLIKAISRIEATTHERDAAIDSQSRMIALLRKQNASGLSIGEEEVGTDSKSQQQDEPRWKWIAQEWANVEVPTLTAFIAECNKNHYPTLPFVSTHRHTITKPEQPQDSASPLPHPAGEFSIITLDWMAFNALAKAKGIPVNPNEVSMTEFVDILNACHLSPACCINDANSQYAEYFPDRLLRAAGNAGVII